MEAAKVSNIPEEDNSPADNMAGKGSQGYAREFNMNNIPSELLLV